jgi:hypothetical protein
MIFLKVSAVLGSVVSKYGQQPGQLGSQARLHSVSVSLFSLFKSFSINTAILQSVRHAAYGLHLMELQTKQIDDHETQTTCTWQQASDCMTADDTSQTLAFTP